ncbi:helix-turn-helix domain-containing protein [[Clostridium] aminophilum]|uniref:helix-turn-helix domain-containing protein n=1 Tax=[Clostridium] aminophilum TaxID=1526 RepID=UPI003319057C
MAGRPKKYHIHLSEQDYKKLKSLIRKKDTPLTIRRRCQIILDLDENHGKMLTYEQCYKSNGVCHATVSNTVAGFAEHGMSYLTSLKRNENSDNARRKVDGRTEALIIEIACSPAPEGHSRWTLRLLEDECKIVLDEHVGKDAIARALKKTNYSLTETPTGASQKKTTPNS